MLLCVRDTYTFQKGGDLCLRKHWVSQLTFASVLSSKFFLFLFFLLRPYFHNGQPSSLSDINSNYAVHGVSTSPPLFQPPGKEWVTLVYWDEPQTPAHLAVNWTFCCENTKPWKTNLLPLGGLLGHFHFLFFLFPFYFPPFLPSFLFGDRVLHSPHWLHIGPELLIILILPPKFWDYRCVPPRLLMWRWWLKPRFHERWVSTLLAGLRDSLFLKGQQTWHI